MASPNLARCTPGRFMRRRWIADDISGDRAWLTGPHAGHLVRVLRARAGQQFEIVCNGVVRLGRIAAIASNAGDPRVEFELGEEILAHRPLPIALVLSIFKFDRMEWAIEKCTELGVARIVPLLARRSESHLAAASAKRVERWRRIAHEASQQSRRSSAPEISPPMQLKDALGLPASRRILLSETEPLIGIKEALSGYIEGDVLLAAGPEGGWTADEQVAFADAGWQAATLGATILRAETAAIAAIAVAAAELSG